MLSNEQIDVIANDEYRNAADSIYATRVHQFGRAIEEVARNPGVGGSRKGVCRDTGGG